MSHLRHEGTGPETKTIPWVFKRYEKSLVYLVNRPVNFIQTNL